MPPNNQVFEIDRHVPSMRLEDQALCHICNFSYQNGISMFNQKSKGMTTMGRLAKRISLSPAATAGSGWPQRRNSTERARASPSAWNQRSLQAAKEELGAEASPFRADVGDFADLDTMFATIKREIGTWTAYFVIQLTTCYDMTSKASTR